MATKLDADKIRRDAKKILDKFGETLERVPETVKKQELSDSFRVEGGGSESDPGFRERFFANAPKTDEDCIIAEKAKW